MFPLNVYTHHGIPRLLLLMQCLLYPLAGWSTTNDALFPLPTLKHLIRVRVPKFVIPPSPPNSAPGLACPFGQCHLDKLVNPATLRAADLLAEAFTSFRVIILGEARGR